MPSETPDKASRTGADATKPARIKVLQRLIGAGIVITVLAAGAAGGAGAYRYVQKSHPQSVLLLQPSPVAQMTESGAVAVKGQVAEVFGNKFIIQDESGRTLLIRDRAAKAESWWPKVKRSPSRASSQTASSTPT